MVRMDMPNAQGFGMQKDEEVNFFCKCLIVLIPKGGNNFARGTTKEQGPLIGCC